MKEQEEDGTSPQGGDGTQPGGPVSNLHERVEALTSQEQDRYFSICHLFGGGAFEVLAYFRGKRTPNQWTTFLSNVKLVNDTDDKDHQYHVSLSQEFPLKEPLRVVDLANKVKSVRARHGLAEFETAILKSCLSELNKVFLVEETEDLNTDGKTMHSVYSPVFSLLINS